MFCAYCVKEAVEAVAYVRKLKVKRQMPLFAVNGAKK